jgi:pimeloyl-ACP methyl ester carboxylesterase
MFAPWLKPEWRAPAARQATIVFVHGAIVRGWEMRLLRHRMRQLGYHVRQFRYRSMMKGLDENVRRLKTFLTATEGDILHVVGHSMGGVLTRLVFEREPDPRPGRLIAIGSPLVKCWVGSRFHRLPGRIGPLMVGRTVADHISSPDNPKWRGTRDFGVLAGIFPIGVGAIFPSHPRPSDGVVLLEETRLQGLRDHATFRLNHFGMLFSKRCTAEIACFLATGSFGADHRSLSDGNGEAANHGSNGSI